MHAIGYISKATGLKIPTIRFYEAEGLIEAPERTEGGRRLYSDADLRRLAFIRHTRSLGFELDDIRSLLTLTDEPDQSCADVDQIARRHLDVIERRISQLKVLRKELARVVQSCAGGKVGHCRVIETLTDHAQCGHDHAPEPKRTKKQGPAKASRSSRRR